MSSLDLQKTYSSYSGVDIKVVIQGQQIGSMQALSYAIQREKAPIYVMGSVDPISFSRGKRGIAGTMISLMLDKHFLDNSMFADGNKVSYPVLDSDEIFANISDENLNSVATKASYDPGKKLPRGLNTAGNAQGDLSSNLSSGWTKRKPFYVDQILPFDVAIVAVNEYGQSAQMRLYGCEILNEGSGFSIDDIVVENQMTYVCRTILPWRKWISNPQANGSQQSSDSYGQQQQQQ